MVVCSSPASSVFFFFLPSSSRPSHPLNLKPPRPKISPFGCAILRKDNSSLVLSQPEAPKGSNVAEPLASDLFCSCISCSFTRRRFFQAAAATALFPLCPSNASNSQSDYMVHYTFLLRFSLQNHVISFLIIADCYAVSIRI